MNYAFIERKEGAELSIFIEPIFQIKYNTSVVEMIRPITENCNIQGIVKNILEIKKQKEEFHKSKNLAYSEVIAEVENLGQNHQSMNLKHTLYNTIKPKIKEKVMDFETDQELEERLTEKFRIYNPVPTSRFGNAFMNSL